MSTIQNYFQLNRQRWINTNVKQLFSLTSNDNVFSHYKQLHI